MKRPQITKMLANFVNKVTQDTLFCSSCDSLGSGGSGGSKSGKNIDKYCLEMKMLSAIAQSVNTSRMGIVQQFLNLGIAENLEANQR